MRIVSHTFEYKMLLFFFFSNLCTQDNVVILRLYSTCLINTLQGVLSNNFLNQGLFHLNNFEIWPKNTKIIIIIINCTHIWFNLLILPSSAAHWSFCDLSCTQQAWGLKTSCTASYRKRAACVLLQCWLVMCHLDLMTVQGKPRQIILSVTPKVHHCPLWFLDVVFLQAILQLSL